MADNETLRQRIHNSVFAKRPEEEYITHLKIWESEGGGDKPRYILLSRVTGDAHRIHKSRLNPNGTFSVGKTWKINELHAVEVRGELDVNVTFARTYNWQTESQSEQDRFLNAVIQLYRESVGSIANLKFTGFTPREEQTASRQRNVSDVGRRPSSSRTNVASRPTSPSASIRGPPPRTPVPLAPTPRRVESPAPNRAATLSRRAESPSISPGQFFPQGPGVPIRTASPAGSSRSRRTASPSRTRPLSPSNSLAAHSTAPLIAKRRQANGFPKVLEPGYTPPPPPTPPVSIPPSTSAPPSSWSRDKESSASPLRPRPSQPNLTSRALSSRSSLDVPSLPSPTGTSQLNDTLSPPSLSRQQSESLGRTPSPALSATSSRGGRSRAGPSPEPPVPSRSGTQASQARRDPNARISFFDPANKALLDRLLFSTADSVPASLAQKASEDGAAARAEGGNEVDDEGDHSQATLADIEEMLDGYEFVGDSIGLKSSKGPADHIESRLLDELLLLERANIHSFLESDDRISTVMKYLEDAITELDGMESTLSSYKIHLNAVGDDIAYIQSQNRGLQVQTQNQKILLTELEKLLQTVHVDREALLTLTQESLEKTPGIQRLEEAGVELYKALLAGRDNDMAATMERLDEYRTHNAQFCKRMLDFLTIMFTAQANILLKDGTGVVPKGRNGLPEIIGHQEIEKYLGRYCGLTLYLKEMDETTYSRLCAAYFSAASELLSKQLKSLMKLTVATVKRQAEDDQDHGFSANQANANWSSGGLRRAGTIVKSPLDLRKDKEKDKQASGNRSAQEALDSVLEQVGMLVYRENDFIADFLQVNDAALTFADYMGLDHYFRRQAAEYSGLSSTTTKLIRGALDLIFGTLAPELKSFIDDVLARDEIQVIGLLASLERSVADAEERGNTFFGTVADKQHQRLKTVFDRYVDEQIRGVEQTKLTAKKRSGVVQFIKYYPTFVSRVEAQLVGASGLEIRGNVDAAYDRIVQAMFDSLKQMAKLDGEQGEEKGLINYHVILIENMHHFLADLKQSKIKVKAFNQSAEGIYNDSLSAYVKLVLRRSFAKIMDYFDGVDRLLKTTAPSEVSKNAAYNRSSLKKIVKDYDSKDIRKHVDALFKRVEKHFNDEEGGTTAPSSNKPNEVLTGVWRACEVELLRATDSFAKHIKQCYADSGITLDYTKQDIEAAFKKHAV